MADDDRLESFLLALFDSGKVVLSGHNRLDASAITPAVRQLLRDTELTYRQGFPAPAAIQARGVSGSDASSGRAPAGPPPFDEKVAAWGAIQLYHACQFHTFRNLGADEIQARLQLPLPSSSPPDAPSTHYSVDLLFQYLADLLALTRKLSPSDPLIAVLEEWGRRWPLASPGMNLAGPFDDEVIWQEPVLARHYAERLIERREVQRWREAPFRQLAREFLGAYELLDPALAEAVLEPETPRR